MQSCAGKIENETALRATIAAIARSIKVECSQRAPPEWIIFSDVYLTGSKVDEPMGSSTHGTTTRRRLRLLDHQRPRS